MQIVLMKLYKSIPFLFVHLFHIDIFLYMELDFFYGLKSAHGIDDFDEYFIQIGSTANLMDPDPAKADQVIYDMTTYWLDDGHSAPISHSYLVDTNSNDDVNFGFSTKTREKLVRSIRAVRDEYPEAKLPYYEVEQVPLNR